MILALTVLAIGAAAVAVAVNLGYVVTCQRRAAKKPLRLLTAGAGLFFIGIYLWALFDPTVYLVRSGILTRLGVIFLLILLMADAIADWRTE